jgi:hypothetical protein
MEIPEGTRSTLDSRSQIGIAHHADSAKRLEVDFQELDGTRQELPEGLTKEVHALRCQDQRGQYTKATSFS